MYDMIISIINSYEVIGMFLMPLLIVFESIIPALPLFVFIIINSLVYGKIAGFIISWVCTCLGCMISYSLVKCYLRGKVIKRIKNVNLLMKCMNYFENMSLPQITVIMSLPITPAFMMNISAGLCNIDKKKYLVSLLISKIFLVLFYTCIGSTLLDGLRDYKKLILFLLMLVTSYIISLIVKKVFKIH